MRRGGGVSNSPRPWRRGLPEIRGFPCLKIESLRLRSGKALGHPPVFGVRTWVRPPSPHPRSPKARDLGHPARAYLSQVPKSEGPGAPGTSLPIPGPQKRGTLGTRHEPTYPRSPKARDLGHPARAYLSPVPKGEGSGAPGTSLPIPGPQKRGTWGTRHSFRSIPGPRKRGTWGTRHGFRSIPGPQKRGTWGTRLSRMQVDSLALAAVFTRLVHVLDGAFVDQRTAAAA